MPVNSVPLESESDEDERGKDGGQDVVLKYSPCSCALR